VARWADLFTNWESELTLILVTHLMARSLETQANHMRARAEDSVAQRE